MSQYADDAVMATTITKTQRWLDLIAFLVKRRFPVAIDDIMDAVPAYTSKWESGEARDRAAVRRMFERDKDDLRALGIPLDTVPYTIDYGAETVDGYKLSSADFYLPYLRLIHEGEPGESKSKSNPTATSNPTALSVSRDELTAAVDSLTRVATLPNSPFRDASRSALRKLAFDLPVDALAPAPVLFVGSPGGEDLRARLRALLDAVRACKKAVFTYHGIHRDAATRRSVAPYGLLFQHGHWYLIAHDDRRDDLRVFRLGRMENLEINDKAMKTPDYEIPADFDLAEYAGRRPWELGGEPDPVMARVRFRFPASLWADRNAYGTLTQALDGGASIREFQVHQVDPFLRWVLSQAGEAIIEEPGELRKAYDDLVRRTREVYSDSALEPPDATG